MTNNLEQRKDAPQGYFNLTVENGITNKKYSVVNFGETMKTHPLPYGLFMGWEAIEMNSKGELMPNNIFRGKSFEELFEQL